MTGLMLCGEINMRRLWHMGIFVCCLLLMAVACRDDSYSGPYDPTQFVNEPIAVVILLGNSDTKAGDGRGVVNDMFDLQNDSVYVSAVKAVEAPSFLNDDTYLVRDRRAIVNAKDARLEWLGYDGASPVYYPWKDRSNESYEMFVNYKDNAEMTKEDVDETHIRQHLTIDGTQDIMIGKCSASTAEEGHDKLYAFSYYTAIRNIVPVLTLQHLLTCLTVQFKSSVSNVRQEIVIKSATVKACDHIILTTASRDDSYGFIGTEGEKVFLGGYMIDEQDPMVLPSVEKPDEQKISIAGNILMPPINDDNIVIYIDAEQILYNTDGTLIKQPTPFHTEIGLAVPGGMLAGYHYAATITVSGSLAIGGKVEVVDWDYGGNIEIDEDKDPEFY